MKRLTQKVAAIALNDFYMSFLSNATPAVSSYDAMRRLRPSQMPNAGGHALGNANAVKAEVLFRFLRDHVLASSLRLRDQRRRDDRGRLVDGSTPFANK